MLIVKQTCCFHDRLACFIKIGDLLEVIMITHYAVIADKQAKAKVIFAVVKHLEQM